MRALSRWSLAIGPLLIEASGGFVDLEFGRSPWEHSYADFLAEPNAHAAVPDFQLRIQPGPLPEVRIDRVLYKARGKWWIAYSGDKLLIPFCIPARDPKLHRLLVPAADFRSGVLHVDPAKERYTLNPFANLLWELLLSGLHGRKPESASCVVLAVPDL